MKAVDISGIGITVDLGLSRTKNMESEGVELLSKI